MITELIRTLSPDGRNGMQIDRSTYGEVKDVLVNVLREGPLPFKALCARTIPLLYDKFHGSPMWFIVNVKLDLEARGEIITSRRGKAELVTLAAA